MDLLKRLHPARSGGAKAAELAFAPRYSYAGADSAWGAPSFDRMSREGYRFNSAVFACVSKHAFAYPQPFLEVVSGPKDEPKPDHLLQKLLRKPNPFMSWSEIALFIAIYKAIGGEMFLHKVRVGTQVRELWPYHVGQMWPVAKGTDWISHYEFVSADGERRTIKRQDVLHLRWPSVDTAQPWRSVAPLITAAREVDTDSEATRYLYALLQNDAAPRTIVTVKEEMSDTAYQRFMAYWQSRHGGDNRGGVALVEGEGAAITRMAMNLEELAFDALRDVPETRIASAFAVPATYAGLNVGQKHSIYNNVSEARTAFFEDTIMQLGELDAGELTNELAAEYAGDLRVRFNYSRIAALQENIGDRFKRALEGFAAGLTTQNEARRYISLPPVGDLGLPQLGDGNVFKQQPAALPLADGRQIIDVQPAKARQLALLALKAASAETSEGTIERMAQTYFDEQYRTAAAAVRAGE